MSDGAPIRILRANGTVAVELLPGEEEYEILKRLCPAGMTLQAFALAYFRKLLNAAYLRIN